MEKSGTGKIEKEERMTFLTEDILLILKLTAHQPSAIYEFLAKLSILPESMSLSHMMKNKGEEGYHLFVKIKKEAVQ